MYHVADPCSGARADLIMHTYLSPDAAVATPVRERMDLAVADTWNLDDIFPTVDAWEEAYQSLDQQIIAYARRQGTLASGAKALLDALQAGDVLGQLAYKVYYYCSLRYDEDTRNNDANARRQRVQVLLAKWRQATSWFNPEMLAIPRDTMRQWLDDLPALAVYRFALEELYRQQEHVLDEKGEHLLSLSAQFGTSPEDTYEALSTADMKFPAVTLSTGETVEATYARYRAIVATNRNQEDRAKAFGAHHEAFQKNQNTYAALYNGVLQRDWFHSQARGYKTMLDASLHGNNIPVSVVENLIATTRAGTEPLRRYERLRRKVLGVKDYHLYDGTIPLVEFDKSYPYQDVLDWITESVAPLGHEYQTRMRRAFAERWIDVYENKGKHSGAYSASVYGVHPYMLLNYNDTLDAVFTLAHEMGHSMHTMLSHETQPFVYAGYTIFVAEVPSTLSEAFLLRFMLARADSPAERIVLLQHAIDEVTSTFYRQVLFATYELEAHRLVERGQPITAEVLSDLYFGILKEYYGDALDYDDLLRVTWARIPHFYGSPYYVYQYATCFASSARIFQSLTEGSDADRAAAVDRYLTLLRSGGSDHPMTLLQRAGVDLSQPETVRAVVTQLDTLVTRLEAELAALSTSK
jgi:oligoendopeptidase F